MDANEIKEGIRAIEEIGHRSPETWLLLLTRVLGVARHHPWVTSTHEERVCVLTYVAAHSGQEVDWRTFAREVQVSEGHLGPLLAQLIEREFVVQPDYRRFVYRLPDALSPQLVLLMRWEAGRQATRKRVDPVDTVEG